MYNILYCYCLVRMLIHDYPCFFDLLFSRWYYSTGFSLQTVVAVSVNVHIIRNPCIAGVIRDVMFTLIAYLVSITTIVPNLHIFSRSTRRAVEIVAIARINSDDGVFRILTNLTTKTRTTTDSTIIYLVACPGTVTRIIIDGTI